MRSRRDESALLVCVLSFVALAGWSGCAAGADWPMWRCTPGRTGATDGSLPTTMQLTWERSLPGPQRGWPGDARLGFDAVTEPVVAGGRLFYAVPGRDVLVALDAGSGNELWHFTADAPIRLAPVASRERVWVGADDGYVTCLDAGTGRVLWRHRAGPADAMIEGNSRIMSAWPVRGGLVVSEGVLYLGAGIWPFMGIRIQALEAVTGAVKWTNDECSYLYDMVDHNYRDVIGVSPQGYFAIDGDRLIVPCGRSWPACFDRKTGKLLYFRQGQPLETSLGRNWKSQSWREGNWHVVASGDCLFNLTPRALLGASGASGAKGGILRPSDGTLIELASRTNVRPEMVADDGQLFGVGATLAAYESGPLAEHDALDIEGAGFAVEAAGKPVPILQATYTSAGTTSKDNVQEAMPPFIAFSSDYHTTLLKLDVSSLADVQVTAIKAALKPSWVRQPGKAGRIVFHRLLTDWSQAACWRKPFPDRDDTWDGILLGTHAEERPFAEIDLDAVRPNTTHMIPGFGNAVAQWASGAWPNYGFLIRVHGPALQINTGIAHSGRQARLATRRSFGWAEKWQLDLSANVMIKVGETLVLGRETEICTVGVGDPVPAVLWRQEIPSGVRSLCAADGRLFAVTQDNRLLAFGDTPLVAREAALEPPPRPEHAVADIAIPPGCLLPATLGRGWTALFGVGSAVYRTVLASPQARIIGFADAGKLAGLRQDLEAVAPGSSHCSVMSRDRLGHMPPYMTTLLVADSSIANMSPESVQRILHPYVGCAVISASGGSAAKVKVWSGKLAELGLAVSRDGDTIIARRSGGIQGAAPWDHEYGGPGRTLCSSDKAIKPPFGVLWFGGEADGLFARPFMIPRYYPSPQVIAGRLLGQNMTSIVAMDVYSGRRLWKADLPSPNDALGIYQPRTPGWPMVSTEDSIYIAVGDTCRVLNPETGSERAVFQLPPTGRAGERPFWNQLLVVDDLLLAGTFVPTQFWDDAYSSISRADLSVHDIQRLDGWSGALRKVGPEAEVARKAIASETPAPLAFGELFPEAWRTRLTRDRANRPATNDRLVALNRHSGNILWEHAAVQGISCVSNRLGNPRHEGVCAGGGRVYVLDALPQRTLAAMRRRGVDIPGNGLLSALDVKTGKALWSTDAHIRDMVSVAYNQKHDIVVIGTGGRQAAYQAASGEALWQWGEGGVTMGRPFVVRENTVVPMFLRGDISGKTLHTALDTMHREWVFLDIVTGKEAERQRAPGAYCGFASAAPAFTAFRSTCVAYMEADGSEVHPLPGLRTACSNNLIAADGVLSVPYMGFHCQCNYPIATSMALIHEPNALRWSQPAGR